jgi:hypothetical protein
MTWGNAGTLLIRSSFAVASRIVGNDVLWRNPDGVLFSSHLRAWRAFFDLDGGRRSVGTYRWSCLNRVSHACRERRTIRAADPQRRSGWRRSCRQRQGGGRRGGHGAGSLGNDLGDGNFEQERGVRRPSAQYRVDCRQRLDCPDRSAKGEPAGVQLDGVTEPGIHVNRVRRPANRQQYRAQRFDHLARKCAHVRAAIKCCMGCAQNRAEVSVPNRANNVSNCVRA